MIENYLSHSYNVELAKKYGVKSAILLGYVFSLRNATLDKEVLLNREQITNATGLTEAEQKEAEDVLYQNHILTLKQYMGKTGGNYYIVNPIEISKDTTKQDTIANMFMPKAMKVVEQESHITKEEVKRDSIKRNLKNSVQVSDETFKQYIWSWIDTIYEKPNGFLSKSAVELAVQELSNFSTDVSVRIEILKIAIKFGYKDIKWAINSYQRWGKKDTQTYSWKPYEETKADRIQTENGAF